MRSDEKACSEAQILRVSPQLVREDINSVSVGGERFSCVRSSVTEIWLRWTETCHSIRDRTLPRRTFAIFNDGT
jgi:hypothetical protein